MNAPIERNQDQDTDWSPCAGGELSGLGQRLRATESRRQQARFATGIAGTGVAALLLVSAFVPGLGLTPDLSGNGISCQQCVAWMPAYEEQLVAKGELASATLTAAEATSVAAHLDVCPKCREKFESMYPGVLAGTAAGFGWLAFAVHRRRV